jgi:hypothetical protein
MITNVMRNLCRVVVHNYTESRHRLPGSKSMKKNRAGLYPPQQVKVMGFRWFPCQVPVFFGTSHAIYSGEMVRRAAIPVLALIASCSLGLALSNPAIDRPQNQQPKTDSKEKADPKEQTASLTGCMDEQEGKWVLVNAQTMAIVATLSADGFPTEAFAKYVGQKVTVRGTASSGGSSSPFKVRTVQTVSETCTAR